MMVMDFKVVEKSDVEGAMIVENLTREIFPKFIVWTWESVLSYINRGSKVFVGYEGDKPVGFIFLRKFYMDFWELTLIGVLNEYRGKGIGKSLLKEALKDIKGEIHLHVQTHNITAISLYEKFGFHKERLIKGFYSDGSDAYLMILRR